MKFYSDFYTEILGLWSHPHSCVLCGLAKKDLHLVLSKLKLPRYMQGRAD